MSGLQNITLQDVNLELQRSGACNINITRPPITLNGMFSKGNGDTPEYAFVHSCYTEMEINQQREIWPVCSIQYVRVLFSHLNVAYSKANLVVPAYKKFKVATLGSKVFAIRTK